jgi:hypothetical protein
LQNLTHSIHTDPTKAQRFLAAVVKQEQGGTSAFYPNELCASTVGGVPTSSAVASAQSSAGAAPKLTLGTAPSFMQSVQQGDVGGALAALTQKQGADADKPSALEQIGKTFEPRQAQGGFQESAYAPERRRRRRLDAVEILRAGEPAARAGHANGRAASILVDGPPGAGIAGPQFAAAGPQLPAVTAPRGVPTMPGPYGLYAPGTTLNSLGGYYG